MTDVAEVTLQDREKIQKYVESNNFLTHTMLANRLGIDKTKWSRILNGEIISAEATQMIDMVISMYELYPKQKQEV